MKKDECLKITLVSRGKKYLIYCGKHVNLKILCFFLRSCLGEYEIEEYKAFGASSLRRVYVYGIGMTFSSKAWCI